jgi:hypothetical protein
MKTPTYSPQPAASIITDSEISAFLAESVDRAESAAAQYTGGLRRCTPEPFDSHEEWYAFAAALEKRLTSGGTRSGRNAA